MTSWQRGLVGCFVTLVGLGLGCTQMPDGMDSGDEEDGMVGQVVSGAPAPPDAACGGDDECDDGSPCTADFCIDGVCVVRVIADSDLDEDGVLDCEDNCVTEANATQDDFDRDGTGDACDSDDDDDGFRDQDDPDPLNRDIPGDFSTPESVVASVIVQDALEEFRSRGFSFDLSLALDPPDITGEYRYETGVGMFIATGNGQDEGRPTCGHEFTVAVGSDLMVERSGRGLCGPDTPSTALRRSTSFALLRGEGQFFTFYQTGTSWCEGDPDAYKSFVGIMTARVDADTGDWLDRISFTVTVATSDRESTRFCDEQVSAGDTEDVGGWDATQTPRINRIGSTSDVGDETREKASGSPVGARTMLWVHQRGHAD